MNQKHTQHNDIGKNYNITLEQGMLEALSDPESPRQNRLAKHKTVIKVCIMVCVLWVTVAPSIMLSLPVGLTLLLCRLLFRHFRNKRFEYPHCTINYFLNKPTQNIVIASLILLPVYCPLVKASPVMGYQNTASLSFFPLKARLFIMLPFIVKQWNPNLSPYHPDIFVTLNDHSETKQNTHPESFVKEIVERSRVLHNTPQPYPYEDISEQHTKRPGSPANKGDYHQSDWVIAIENLAMRMDIPPGTVTETSIIPLYATLYKILIQRFLSILTHDELDDVLMEVLPSLTACGGSGGDDDDNNGSHTGYGFGEPAPLIIHLGTEADPEQRNVNPVDQCLEKKRQLLDKLQRKLRESMALGNRNLTLALRDRIMLIEVDEASLENLQNKLTEPEAHEELNPGILALLEQWIWSDSQEVHNNEYEDLDLLQTLMQNPAITHFDPTHAVIVSSQLNPQEAHAYKLWRETSAGLVYLELKQRLWPLLHDVWQDEAVDNEVRTQRIISVIIHLETLKRQFEQDTYQRIRQHGGRQTPGGQGSSTQTPPHHRMTDPSQSVTTQCETQNRQNLKRKGGASGGRGNPPEVIHTRDSHCPLCRGFCRKRKPQSEHTVVKTANPLLPRNVAENLPVAASEVHEVKPSSGKAGKFCIADSLNMNTSQPNHHLCCIPKLSDKSKLLYELVVKNNPGEFFKYSVAPSADVDNKFRSLLFAHHNMSLDSDTTEAKKSTPIHSRYTTDLKNKGYYIDNDNILKTIFNFTEEEIANLQKILIKSACPLSSTVRYQAQGDIIINVCSNTNEFLIVSTATRADLLPKGKDKEKDKEKDSELDIMQKIVKKIVKENIKTGELKCGIIAISLNIHTQQNEKRLIWHSDKFTEEHGVTLLQTAVLSTTANQTSNKQYLQLGVTSSTANTYGNITTCPPLREEKATGQAVIDADGTLTIDITKDNSQSSKNAHPDPATVYLVANLSEKPGAGYAIDQTRKYQTEQNTNEKYIMVHSSTSIQNTSENNNFSNDLENKDELPKCLQGKPVLRTVIVIRTIDRPNMHDPIESPSPLRLIQ